jgi:hypothetical protein
MDNKMDEFAKHQKKHQQRQRESSKKREGEISIDYAPDNASKNKPDKGDYVDYIEVKD